MRNLLLIALLLVAATGLVLWAPWDASAGPAPMVATDPVVASAEDPDAAVADATPGAGQASDAGGERVEVATAPEAPSSTGLVRGRAVDEAGRPIAGARVVLGKQLRWFDDSWFLDPKAPLPPTLMKATEVETDADGRFEVAPPSTDDPTTVVLVDGRHALQREEAVATAGEVVDLGDITMPLGVVVEGRVIDDAGQPVADAKLSVPNGFGIVVVEGGDAVRGARSRVDGTFSVLLAEAGEFELIADHPDFAKGRGNGTAGRRGDVVTGVIIRMGATADIAGVVTGLPSGGATIEVRAAKLEAERRRPVDGVEIDFTMPLRFAQDRAKVAKDGSFRIKGLERGTGYRIAAFDVSDGGWRGTRVSDVLETQSGDTNARVAFASGVRIVFDAVDASTGAALGKLRANARVDEGNDLPGMVVDLLDSDSDLEAGSDGRFRVEPIRPGPNDRTFSLSIEAKGFAAWKREKIAIPASAELDLGRIELQPAPTLRVRIVDAEGEPVAKARVRFQETEHERVGRSGMVMRTATVGFTSSVDGEDVPFSIGGDGRLSGRTDENGEAVLTLEPGMKGTVRAMHAKFAPRTSEELEAPVRGEFGHELTLGAGGAIVVKVVDQDGEVVAGANLSCNQVGGPPSFGGNAKETDKNGIVRFERLEDGTYDVEFEKKREGPGVFMMSTTTRVFGGSDSDTPIEDAPNRARVLGGNTVELTIVKPAKSKLVGVVTEDGVPLDGAKVKIQTEDPRFGAAVSERVQGVDLGALMGGGGGRAETDDAGRFEIDDVDAGELTLVVSHPERAMSARVKVQALAGETRCDIALHSTRVQGRVVDEEGKPVARARVTARRATNGVEREVREMRISIGGPGNAEGRGGGRDRAVRTDRQGRFELVGVEHDVDLVLDVRARGHADSESAKFQVAPGGTQRDIVVTAARGGAIDVRVRGDYGMFAMAEARPEGAEGRPPKTELVQGGKARLKGLTVGRWVVSLRPMEGGEPEEKIVEVRAGETATAEFSR